MGRRGHGEGSVYQRASDGRWMGVIDLGWQGGKRVRKTVSAKAKGDVLTKMRALARNMDAGVLTDSTTVAEWMTYWLDEVAGVKNRPNTMRSYRSKTKRWIVPHLGKHRLDGLRPEHVRRLYDAQPYEIAAALDLGVVGDDFEVDETFAREVLDALTELADVL